MARRRLRLTGFTRFLLFLMIITPMAYFGVLYSKGEKMPTSIEEVWETFRPKEKAIQQKEAKATPAENSNLNENTNANSGLDNSKSNVDCSELEEEIKDLEERYLRKSNKVDDLEAEIEGLKKQIDIMQKDSE
ncbi:MAG: hypothetical protein NXI23_12910 [Bacteroidetes bacterium]|jgi:molecular chaperone GrpE (heat shock protein)|nr:hypothetical protein [Bacteroidota bacterium]MDF1865155.1 hypothetical protein [Saprospiraceae bacterium]